ncbi:hypothetical protein [Effusibacillus consociatus]|uniref:Uncharacterized protein n=1 Tax=Effusibacillus consociatus TaxID=1117041 RepID=A0ABV9Q9D2_9BACL
MEETLSTILNEMSSGFDQVHTRFDTLEKQMDELEQRLDNLEHRIHHFDLYIEKLETKLVSTTRMVAEIAEELTGVKSMVRSDGFDTNAIKKVVSA